MPDKDVPKSCGMTGNVSGYISLKQKRENVHETWLEQLNLTTAGSLLELLPNL